ncbi:hypothetical protein ACRE8P_08385 [Klebsiella pneumoniae]|uniref:hypothetical protein n=1 Tax=Klebsiella pneumoniae complex TaxID=3390273 RepID=UPI000C7DA704|nr:MULTISPECIES: hypothetical protein [Klebsiella]MBK0441252.1 hypothetical protein [Klebsiella pneumoniae]MBK0462745.1 hypothetical protein [Klebsiella pneumoniae]MCX9729564.1 hypothetical protein [Klebsiella pneumoniae]MDM9304816.1 hypothetical protein [Klebsiella quasipneumoniae subsp. similipneumoniae]MDY1596173.1 hypothetical protein [Klebsiella pneumoniae]
MSFQRTVKVKPTRLYQDLAGVQVPEQEEEVIATYTAIRIESLDANEKLASVYYSISLENASVLGYGYANFNYQDPMDILDEAETYLLESLNSIDIR